MHETMKSNHGVVKKVHRKDIQALRGITVLAIIIFHASKNYLPNGYLGVDMFFVISGFVVTPLLLRMFLSNNEKHPFEFCKYELMLFLKKRFLRLAPALGATLIITVILAVIFLPPKDLGRFAGQGLASLLLLGNLGAYHYVGEYFYPNPNPLVHTWSLSTEEQIYLLIPFILFLVFKVKGIKTQPSNILKKTYLFLGILSFFQFFIIGLFSRYSASVSVSLVNFNFYSVTGRIWEFVFGGAIFFYLKSAKKNTWRDSRLLKLLSTVGVSIILCWPNPVGTPYGEFLACLSAGAFIGLTGPVLRKIESPLAWIGDRSYSLYLIHMPLLYLAFYSPLWSDGYNRRPGKLVALALTFVLGFLIYELVEKKFRVAGSTRQIPSASLWKISRIFLLTPFLLLLPLFTGSSGNFYGFDQNPKRIDPGQLDPACYSQLGAEPCIYGDVSANNHIALLVGDSHARHLTIGFREAAESAGYTAVIWTQSGCQFVLRSTMELNEWQKLADAWGRKQHREKQSCVDHNNQILRWVQTHPTATVFVTQRSTSYPEKDFGVDIKQYVKSNLKDIQKLQLKSNKVIVIGPTPEFPDFTKFFAGNTLLWEQPYEITAKREFMIKEMIQNPFFDDQIMRKELARLQIEYISTINIFCNEDKFCSRYQNGNWLYTDGDHLSIEGSRLLKTAIVTSLQKN